jgi:hypothetical protein
MAVELMDGLPGAGCRLQRWLSGGERYGQGALPGSLRPLLLSGGVLSRRRVRLVWCRQVKTAGLAREAGRRKMSAPGRVPGFRAGYVAGEGDLPGHGLACKEA